MKESRLFLILLIMLLIIGIQTAFSQSFYANKYDKKGRTSQLNSKTVAQKKLTVYQKHSNLYKIRREIAHSKKRKSWKITRL